MPEHRPREPQTMRKLRHDMRTPLGQIIGYSEMLEEEAGERGQGDLIPDLQRIRSAAHALLELLDGVFRSETAKSPHVPEQPGEADSSSPTATAAERAVGAAHGSLLVIDDDAQSRNLLARRLERSGYAVGVEADGRSALHRLEASRFDVVLLDVMMPGMSGLEVLTAIRETRSQAQLPVIMATGLGDSEDVVAALQAGANDYVTKPFDYPVVLARLETQLALVRASREIEELARQLEIRNAFMRKTFGRYVSDEVVDSVLEGHEGLELRGETRRLSILMADLRGFTTLTESLPATELVWLLNNHLGTMAEVVQSHHGIVDEFIGDAILAFFGAPLSRGGDAERAVACAVAMQRALESVNERNRARGVPEVEMGIGIATGDLVVGNIGSQRRSKYAAVGSAINLAARIESYTLGGDILICDETRRALGSHVRIESEREVQPKGFDVKQRIHRVMDVGAGSDRSSSTGPHSFVELVEEIPVHFAVLEGKEVPPRRIEGRIWAASANGLRIRSLESVDDLREIHIQLLAGEGASSVGCYAKAVHEPQPLRGSVTVRLTARSPAIDACVDRALPRAPA